jgi:hypothetical protein
MDLKHCLHWLHLEPTHHGSKTLSALATPGAHSLATLGAHSPDSMASTAALATCAGLSTNNPPLPPSPNPLKRGVSTGPTEERHVRSNRLCFLFTRL